MDAIDLSLAGLKLIKPKIYKDNRGYFLESFQEVLYQKLGISCPFVQDNHSYSQKGCIRGMHFQSFPGQAKLVRVAVGEIYDVAVDIRGDSPTFGKWEGVILNDQNHHQLFIPAGFAHGFCVLSEETHVLYKVSTPYDAKFEKSFQWNDPQINIQWPCEKPILSEKDLNAFSLKEVLKTL